MRKMFFSIAWFAAVCFISIAPGYAEPTSEEVGAVVQGNRLFAHDLYGQLAGQEEGNLFFSPYSISTALAMTYAGARSQTETEMAAVLHFPLSQDRFHPAMGGLISSINSPERTGYTLRVANRLWGQQGMEFQPSFLDTTRQHYGAELAEVDYIFHTEDARQTINRWVEDQTEQKIRDLIPQGALSSDTRLVLTNAIYFLRDWKHPFNESATRDRSFHLDATDTISVPMMRQTRRFRYMETDDFQLLDLPYENDELSMLLLLPRERDGLSSFEASFSDELLQESIDQMRYVDVSVSLPKFTMTQDFELKDTLVEMGMASPFTDAADFSGISSESELKISKVIHKAFIQVDEQGTEAAAATAVIMDAFVTSIPVFPPLPPEVFNADHPFAFLIRDNQTDSILFMGRVMEPQWNEAAAVPEPASWMLALLGAVPMVTARRRRRRAR